jgi:hypothetical protein
MVFSNQRTGITHDRLASKFCKVMVVSDQKQWFVVEHAAQEGIIRRALAVEFLNRVNPPTRGSRSRGSGRYGGRSRAHARPRPAAATGNRAPVADIRETEQKRVIAA